MTTDHLDHITVFAMPISEAAPCGDDPRYLDDFLRVKEEIDKLAETNYEEVYQVSHELLTTTCKDLRLGAYYLLASVYLHGLDGLGQGLAGYRGMIEGFWVDCHPQRENPRLAALSLLNTTRLIAFAEQRAADVNRDVLAILKTETTNINNFLIAQLGDEAPRLTGLASWCEKQEKFLPAEEPKPQESTESAPQPQRVAPPQQAVQLGSISSPRELEAETRKLHGYLCDNNDLYRAIALSRAMLWSADSVPTDDQGKTRVPPPRQTAFAELQTLADAEDSDAALVLSEKVFFETGFRYSLTLQHFVWQRAKQRQQSDIVTLIETTTLNYMERFPQLKELRFADDTPFCCLESSQWLDELKQQRAAQTGNQSSLSAETTSEELTLAISEATALARQKKLPEALSVLRAFSTENSLVALQQQLAEAQMCHLADKPQLAEVALEALYRQAQEHSLETWHPEMMLSLIQLRAKVVQALLKPAKQGLKERLQQTMEELQRAACRIDLLAASRFIS